MTKIVAATIDFTTDFSNSFGTWVNSVSFIDYQAKDKNLNNEIEINWLRLSKAKLVIFTGGEDISPAIYGHQNTYSYGVNVLRDKAELAVLKYALKTQKKILGICRGHQLINAFLDGVLVQDIQFEMGKAHQRQHSLNPINGGGAITDLFKKVNSIHHQGVINVGKGLKATSTHEGVIESCESDNIITTQFHPEFMYNKESGNFFDFIKDWANLKE